MSTDPPAAAADQSVQVRFRPASELQVINLGRPRPRVPKLAALCGRLVAAYCLCVMCVPVVNPAGFAPLCAACCTPCAPVRARVAPVSPLSCGAPCPACRPPAVCPSLRVCHVLCAQLFVVPAPGLPSYLPNVPVFIARACPLVGSVGGACQRQCNAVGAALVAVGITMGSTHAAHLPHQHDGDYRHVLGAGVARDCRIGVRCSGVGVVFFWGGGGGASGAPHPPQAPGPNPKSVPTHSHQATVQDP